MPLSRLVGLLAYVLVLVPALIFVPLADSYLVRLPPLQAANRATVDWIERNTELEDVFACEPLFCHLVVAGLSGRKCMAVPIGHITLGKFLRRKNRNQ